MRLECSDMDIEMMNAILKRGMGPERSACLPDSTTSEQAVVNSKVLFMERMFALVLPVVSAVNEGRESLLSDHEKDLAFLTELVLGLVQHKLHLELMLSSVAKVIRSKSAVDLQTYIEDVLTAVEKTSTP